MPQGSSPVSRRPVTRLLAALSLSLATLAPTLTPGLALAADDMHFDQPEAFATLKKAVGYFDEMDTLPEEAWISRDQASARSDMDEMIEEAMQALDVPQLSTLRSTYRQVEDKIRESRREISELKEKRILAPDTEVSTLTRFTPTDTLREFTASTRGDYDLLIAAHEKNITAYQGELTTLEGKLAARLEEIGITLTPDQVQVWLSSVVGDDVLTMSVVFASIKSVAQQLAELTRDSGENLEYARRYYGMVVMLHRMIVTMQQDFIARVDDEVLPQLQGFADEAEATTRDARALIKQGGSRESLENNIRANALTLKTINLYRSLVSEQRDRVKTSLTKSQRELAVATNTYRTVKLSAHVADLIRQGVKTFDTLAGLQVPVATSFENSAMREEFRKLTERMQQAK
ncbi:hypothetical protein QD172_00845 [Cobetia sp. 10Alg 146]|uniref:hypothetical protein n=1 Tax=Cobetia sp. 10Alg 146 TaxID=3040019 RepID=UPI00244CEE38|nr:hypothetical protein [Cobetia sp. 10Alg 146]MDH2289797.1 hypothetical protein [Cobetia sp. 10Alg 146]